MTKYITTLEERLHVLKELKRIMPSTNVTPKYREAFYYRLTTLDFGLEYYAFVIGWYRKFMQKIETGEVKL